MFNKINFTYCPFSSLNLKYVKVDNKTLFLNMVPWKFLPLKASLTEHSFIYLKLKFFVDLPSGWYNLCYLHLEAYLDYVEKGSM